MARRQSSRILNLKNVSRGTKNSQTEEVNLAESEAKSDNEQHENSNDAEPEASALFVIDTKPGVARAKLPMSQSDSDSDSSESDDESEEDDKDESGAKTADKSGLLLSSSLQPGISFNDTYLNTDTFKSPSVYNRKIDKLLSSKSKENELLKKSVFQPSIEKQDKLPPYRESVNQLKKQRRKEKSQTKGSGWFNMKAPELTEEKKNEILVLQMRKSLDPKRFYKAPDIRGIPKFFQTGRVLDGPTDFYKRIPKRAQKRSLVDELLADAEFKKFSKRKLSEIQEKKKYGKGAYKRMKRMKKAKK